MHRLRLQPLLGRRSEVRILRESEVSIVDAGPPDVETAKCVTGARLCYKSEGGNREKDDELIVSLIRKGHDAMLEHGGFSAIVTTDRGVTHELVRHRLFSFAQESTRYCNYSKDKFGGEIAVMCPKEIWDVPSPEGNATWLSWEAAVQTAERSYLQLIDDGLPSQIARAVLPTCLVSTIMITGNFRQWRHFFKIRALGRAGKPHSGMKDVATKLLALAVERYPIMFTDLKEELDAQG